MIKNFKTNILIVIIMAITPNIVSAQNSESEKVVLQLRWNHQFQFAGYYAAKWQGYYAEEGLDVEIESGSGEGGHTQFAPEKVLDGSADFGIGSSDILLANDKTDELMVVASFFQKSPVRYYMLKSQEYNNLADLENKRIGIRDADLLSIEFKSMLSIEGVDLNRLSLVDKDASFGIEDLTSKKYDLVPGYVGGAIEYNAIKEKIDLKELKAIDYGIDFYGDSLFTKKELVRENPELVEKFRRASVRGWKYALENPDQIIDRIVSDYENKEQNNKAEFKEYNEFQSKKVAELMLYPIVEIGNINPYRWKDMSKILKQSKMIEAEPDIEELIFNYDEISRDREEKSLNQFIQLITVAFLFSLVLFFINLRSKNSDLEREIVEKEEAEKRLKKEKDRYEVLFNSSTIGIVLTKGSGEIIQCNKKWMEMTGYQEKELIGRSMKDIISSEENEMPNELIAKLISEEISEYEVEQKYIKKDKGCFWGNLFMVAMDDRESYGKTYLNMVADITAKKLMEESVDRAEARFRDIIDEVASEINVPIHLKIKESEDKTKVLYKLERINLELEKLFKNELDENRKKEVLIIHQAKLAAMGEMIGNIAHQWRQPLNSLGLVLANLEDDYKHGELEVDFFESSMEKSKKLISRMSNTIDDFRYFFNPIDKKEKFCPCETIEQIIYLLEEKLRFNDINIVFPNSDRVLTAYGYKSQYSQALFNVISNSIDALGEKDVIDKRIEVHLYECEESLVCEIKDNAGGIGEDILYRIFEMYFTTKPGKKGTGLGLYITKTIIENNLKGKVSCENTKNGLMTKISIPKESGEDKID